ncbi:archaetidylserine decarboxylase [Alkalimarinus sediminis]|uniref:Phosphatidylserine decarboxylase proenzyme n=1 Tax=Alkalimarinus sediminis TaxID=1632866 RepID=A0A9E8KQ07_9ALTE|nr:archaetidylserine decarboxylase [Alkalimarinus sediminis]UZW74107.1 archaetidylserine decarboxylase [Alkalimarinus sediminis]
MLDNLFVLSQYLTPQHTLSRTVGMLADCKQPQIKDAFIKWFIKKYQVNMAEAAKENPSDFPCFNDFFTRELKPGLRPIADGEHQVSCPVDGAISQLGDIKHGQIFQAKGQDYSLIDLLGGNVARAKPFMGGKFATIYLSPKDYHRIHMPLSGTLREMIYVPGKLFSVNPVTAENVPGLFARNERLVAIFDTEFGPMAMVLVGAMIVAAIETVWSGQVAPPARKLKVTEYPAEPTNPITLNKGDEMGRFKLGSTVVLAFPENMVEFTEELKAGTVVRMGQEFGKLPS